MKCFRSSLAVLLSALMTAPAGLAQAPSSGVNLSPQASWAPLPKSRGGWFLGPYQRAEVPEVNLTNSNRLESLLRAGKLYLSLQDAIALALENNLDIEVARLSPRIAQTDYLRAKAGGLLRGVPTSVSSAPSSALSQVTGGTGGSAAGATSVGSSSSSNTSSGVGGAVITQTGVSVPSLDPTVFFGGFFGHNSSPQSNTVTTGTTALTYDNRAYQAGYQQNFLTGTTVNYNISTSYTKSNNPYQDINPVNTSNMQLQFTQRLLQGFGLAVNNRNIRVAKNNLKISDLVFTQQVMTTVSGVVNLYWDLVSFNEDLKVKQKALEVAQKFYEDNKKQVEIGTLAPIEIVRAEARTAQAQQDLTNSETSLLQQETIVKNALSKNGTASPSIADARIIPTDALTMPSNDAVPALGELIEAAFKNRPDIEQTKINVRSSKIALAGTRSALLPSLDLQANLQNNGLAGDLNTVTLPGVPPRSPDAYFLGGVGSSFGQVFRRNFPNYSVYFQLNVPLRNRTAQADYARDLLSIRQQELQQQQQLNDVRVNVQNALTAVVQARARYLSAVKARQLQEQTLDAENKKYALGASTAFQVVQTQRDLAQAQADEVTALSSYSRARVQLDLSTGAILSKYNVAIDDARRGVSSRPMQAPVVN